MRETCVRATGSIMGEVFASLQLDEVRAALPMLEKLRQALDTTR